MKYFFLASVLSLCICNLGLAQSPQLISPEGLCDSTLKFLGQQTLLQPRLAVDTLPPHHDIFRGRMGELPPYWNFATREDETEYSSFLGWRARKTSPVTLPNSTYQLEHPPPLNEIKRIGHIRNTALLNFATTGRIPGNTKTLIAHQIRGQENILKAMQTLSASVPVHQQHAQKKYRLSHLYPKPVVENFQEFLAGFGLMYLPLVITPSLESISFLGIVGSVGLIKFTGKSILHLFSLRKLPSFSIAATPAFGHTSLLSPHYAFEPFRDSILSGNTLNEHYSHLGISDQKNQRSIDMVYKILLGEEPSLSIFLMSEKPFDVSLPKEVW